MKIRLIIFFTILLTKLSAQTVDSATIRQVDSLIKVTIDFTAQREFDKALETNAIAGKLALEKLGRESAAYGKVCLNRGNALFYKGDYREAEKCYNETISVREKVFGKEHPEYAAALGNLASMYTQMGRFKEALPLALEVQSILEKALGTDHPDYATSLLKLGSLNAYMGQYDKAEKYFLQARDIWGKALGVSHPKYVLSLTGLGNLYLHMDQYEKAEAMHLEAKSIKEKLNRNDDPDYAATLVNLGILYDKMGQGKKAESLLLTARSIHEKAVGKDHPDYANDLEILAIIYNHMAKVDKAESLYLEVRSIREKVFGKDHPFYTGTLYNLAILYMNKGELEKAEPLYLEAISIDEKVLGKDHPDYANDLGNLAILYRKMGQFSKAEQLALEAKSIIEKGVGKENSDYASSLNCLGQIYADMGLFEKATPFFLEQSNIHKILLEKAVHHLSEKELNAYMRSFSKSQNEAFLLAREHRINQAIPACYDNILFYKGFLLNAVNQVKRLALANPLATDKYNEWKEVERLLAREYTKPISKRKGLAEMEEKSLTLEKELTRMVAGYAEALRQVNWQDVQSELKPGEAALEFVHFRKSANLQEDSFLYSALLVVSGTDQPRFISLFEEKDLDYLMNAGIVRKSDYVNNLYSLSGRGAIAVEEPGKSLYQILWQPLEKELAGISTIYFSPSGLLHRINLNAIPISETETLADKYKLFELNSTRQLVIPTQIQNVNNDAVLYGGIQFEQDSINQNNEPLIVSRSRGELSFNAVESTLRGGSWNYLPGTEREVKAIEKIMQTASVKTNLRKGNQATEETFKNIGTNNSASPRILHIATHGYFFADPKSTTKKDGLDSQGEPVFKISDHPMMRSGLIMAGGNAAWQGKQTLEGREDGILTAYEISQMNLSNTELVVLSACETGLGDIQGNEGVYGLQRAFKIAGAKYLIMSLWQVPDKQTSLLMTTFYKKWLEDKMSIPDAFHAAQKELREVGLDPYQWAGFVLVE